MSLTASYDFSRYNGNENDVVSFHDDRSSFLAQLMELGFAEADCRRGLEQSHYQSVEAAVEWITSHPQTQSLAPQLQQLVRKNSFLEENDTTSPQPAALVPVRPGHNAESAHPTVPSRVGQRLLLSIQQLRQGIRSDPSVTHLSRQVVTLFLSRRLPNELCWLIFSYAMSSEDIKRILLCGNVAQGTGTGSIRETQYSPYENADLSLRSSYLTTQALLSHASRFLSNQQKAILEAKISTPNTLSGR